MKIASDVPFYYLEKFN